MSNFSNHLFLISSELSRRLRVYPDIISRAPEAKRATVRDELNHRYLCLQMAHWIIDQKGRRPAITKTDEEVRAELLQWQRDLQRTATVENYRVLARNVALIQEVIDRLKPVERMPKQSTIFNMG